MNLAKIRKKALLVQHAPQVAAGTESAITDIPQAPQRPEDSRSSGSGIPSAELQSDALLTATGSLQHTLRPLLVSRYTTIMSPLERILAGRADIGCDEELQSGPPEQVPSEDSAFEEFLCIRVSDETYGISIMSIKEIITPRQVTEVPRAPSFVCGVISLRGVIISVLDMTGRLGLRRSASTGKERVVVVKAAAGDSLTGLLVDQVTHVARVASASIEAAPVTLEGVDRDFVKGIGRADNRLIILLNIEAVVDIQLT